MKNWLHVGSVFVLTFLPAAFIHKRILCIHNGLPWETCPSVWMLNQNAFFSGLCPPLDGYQRKKLTHPLLQAGHSRRHLQDQCPLYITSSIPLFSFYKKKLASRPQWDGSFEILVFYLLSQLAFWIALFLASAPHLWFTGLLWGEQSEFGLSNIYS